MGSKILKTSYYLPKGRLTNNDLIQEFPDWDMDKTANKIGILERPICEAGQTSVDMAVEAGFKVLEDFDKDVIDFVILCTQSPDYILPTSACMIQNRLGLSKKCGAIDFNLGCSGYVYGLSIAKGLIAGGIAKNVLLITSETYSKHIHPKDIANRAIFGDAATASIITSSSSNNILNFNLGTDGSGFDKLIIKNGGVKFSRELNPEEFVYGNGNVYSNNHLYMDGPEIFNFTIENVPHLVNNTLLNNSLTLDDVDYFIFHQANQYMLNYLRRKVKIPKEKFCIDMEKTGNTVSSTIPIALANSIKKELVKSGDKVMLVGFGVGLSWGATIVEI